MCVCACACSAATPSGGKRRRERGRSADAARQHDDAVSGAQEASGRFIVAAAAAADRGVLGGEDSHGGVYVCSFHYDHIRMVLGPAKQA